MTDIFPPKTSIDALLDEAFAAIDRNDPGKAKTLCAHILTVDPACGDALVLTGMLATQEGRPNEAIAYLERAIAADPSSPDAHIQLAAALAQTGRPEDAVPLLRRAVELAPDDAIARHDLGLLLQRSGQFQEAMASFTRAAMLNPDSAPIQYRLGMVLERSGREAEAVDAYRKAAKGDPKLTGAHVRLAFILLSQGKPSEAYKHLRVAADLEPESEIGAVAAARLLIAEDRLAEAVDKLDTALAHSPRSAGLHQLRGTALRQLGRFDEATACLVRSIMIDPENAFAYYDLVTSKKVTEADRPLVARMEDMAAADIGDATRLAFHFALGHAYNDLGNYENAMRHFDEANRLKRSIVPFDSQWLVHYVDQTIRTFSSPVIDSLRARGSTSERPIFILGLPRSGTTLVEQILSSHPIVGAGGELMFWAETMDAFAQTTSGMNEPFLRDAAVRYLKLLEGLAPTKARTTDKLPANFLRAGLLYCLFPNARIVSCRRHPVDIALSLYFTYFQEGNEYAYDKDSIALFIQQHDRLAEHWRAVLPPDRYLEVEYESVVADPEAQTRALLDFCDLSWDDACLRPQENKRVVKTASMWQARQPVYKSSVERWRRYEPWLGELRQLLPIETTA